MSLLTILKTSLKKLKKLQLISSRVVHRGRTASLLAVLTCCFFLSVNLFSSCGIYSYPYVYPPQPLSPPIGFLHPKENYDNLFGYSVFYRFYTAGNNGLPDFQTEADTFFRNSTHINRIRYFDITNSDGSLSMFRTVVDANADSGNYKEPMILRSDLSEGVDQEIRVTEYADNIYLSFADKTLELFRFVKRNSSSTRTPKPFSRTDFDITDDDLPFQGEDSFSGSIVLAIYAVGIGGGDSLPPPAHTKVVFIGSFKFDGLDL